MWVSQAWIWYVSPAGELGLDGWLSVEMMIWCGRLPMWHTSWEEMAQDVPIHQLGPWFLDS